MTTLDRIAVDPTVHFGKPCVAGTRVPVQSVLELINDGIGFDEIVADYYPVLTVEDVRACIEYAISFGAEKGIQTGSETALLSEDTLAEDWSRPEEDETWSHLQSGQ